MSDLETARPECLHRCRRIETETLGGKRKRWRCILCGHMMKILNGVNQDALDAHGTET